MDGRLVYDKVKEKKIWMTWKEIEQIPEEQFKNLLNKMGRFRIEGPSYFDEQIHSKLINCFRLAKGLTLLVFTDRTIVCDNDFEIFTEVP